MMTWSLETLSTELAQVLTEGGDGKPLYLRLTEQIQAAILQQRLLAGAKLPSIRRLSSELGISRNTVVAAYDQLLAEGFLVSRPGAGTFVTEALSASLLDAHFSGEGAAKDAGDAPGERPLSRRSEGIVDLPSASVYPQRTSRAFRYGLPALEHFPFAAWARLSAYRYRSARPSWFDYDQMSGGDEGLREAIAHMLRSTRGLRCDASQVLITTGAQQGIYLAAQLLLDPGDTILVEEPGYQGAMRIFAQTGATLVPVPVDDEGFDIARGEALAPDAKVAFVTPSRQHPLGMTMSLARRVALIDWADRVGGWMLEDDYDSAYSYEGPPLSSLQGLDTHRRVIYIGTMSKVMFPALRIGYLVAPPDLVGKFLNLRGILDTYTPTIQQRVLADFLEEGLYARHLRKMRKLYQQRRDDFLDFASSQLGEWLTWGAADAGMSITAWLPDGIDDAWVHRQALAQGIVVSPISHCYASTCGGVSATGLVFGYVAADHDEMIRGVRVIKEILERRS